MTILDTIELTAQNCTIELDVFDSSPDRVMLTIGEVTTWGKFIDVDVFESGNVHLRVRNGEDMSFHTDITLRQLSEWQTEELTVFLQANDISHERSEY